MRHFWRRGVERTWNGAKVWSRRANLTQFTCKSKTKIHIKEENTWECSAATLLCYTVVCIVIP